MQADVCSCNHAFYLCLVTGLGALVTRLCWSPVGSSYLELGLGRDVARQQKDTVKLVLTLRCYCFLFGIPAFDALISFLLVCCPNPFLYN